MIIIAISEEGYRLCYNVDCSKPKDPKNPCETSGQPVFLLFRAKSIQSTNSY